MAWSHRLLDIEIEIHRFVRENPEAKDTQPFADLRSALQKLMEAWTHIRAYEIETGRE